MRIGIANDLPIAVEALRLVLEGSGRHAVAWIARDGREAVGLCASDRPDLILMDLQMPGLDGVAATRRIMRETPCPILIATASVGSSSAQVFEALGAGAIDAVNTPALGSSDAQAESDTFLWKLDSIERLITPVQPRTPAAGERSIQCVGERERDNLVAIGSSAGGPAALASLLRQIPSSFAAGIVIIQHLDEHFAQGLAEWLGQACALPVRLAVEGDRPAPGTVLVAGSSNHLVLLEHGALGYTPEPRDRAYRPSVDVFLESVARHWKGEAAGVLLTGMGRDGASGLKMLREAGYYTIAQDRGTSAVYGMPKAAAELGAAIDILALPQIVPALLRRFHRLLTP